MQATQYGVAEVPQFVVGRVPPPHGYMFNLSHEMCVSPSSSHSHPQSHSSHPQQHHHQQNHSHHQQPQQLHVPHSQHQQHHAQSQQQQLQQQHSYVQQSQKQQQQQAQSVPAQAQQQQHVQPSQPQMAQQLGVSSGSPTDTTSPVANRPPFNNTFSKALIPIRDESLDAEEQDALGEEGERGTAGNRWPRQETLALLKVRSDMDAAFRDSSLKGPLWEEVSRNLAEMGYHRSAKKCKEKFENVHKYYKRTKDGKAGRQDGKSYRFFSQLEALYGKSGIVGNISHKNATGLLTAGVAGIGGSFGLGTTTIPKTRGPFVSTAEPVGAFGTGDRTGSGMRPESDISSGLNFSSDSSDDDFEDPADSENLDCKKRKRKSTKKYLLLFENIMKKVLDKQEQLQQKFLEALERRDQDRMIREEAWKRQEMARLNREHDLRAQERALSSSRDAALVAFLQKATGQTLQLPQMAMQVQSTALVPVDMHDDLLRDKEFYDPSSKRWPKPEVLSLIRLRTGLDQKFHEPGSKGLLWEDISAGMSREGYSRTAKRCKEKWTI